MRRLHSERSRGRSDPRSRPSCERSTTVGSSRRVRCSTWVVESGRTASGSRAVASVPRGSTSPRGRSRQRSRTDRRRGRARASGSMTCSRAHSRAPGSGRRSMWGASRRFLRGHAPRFRSVSPACSRPAPPTFSFGSREKRPVPGARRTACRWERSRTPSSRCSESNASSIDPVSFASPGRSGDRRGPSPRSPGTRRNSCGATHRSPRRGNGRAASERAGAHTVGRDGEPLSIELVDGAVRAARRSQFRKTYRCTFFRLK